jgi:hypothetical protein
MRERGVPSEAPKQGDEPGAGAGIRLLIGLLSWPVTIVVVMNLPSCMGFEEPTLRALDACPRAAGALGAPISRSWAGRSCGSATTSHATWRFPVAGTEASGSVEVEVEEHGDAWEVRSLRLHVGDRTIDALRCEDVAGP